MKAMLEPSMVAARIQGPEFWGRIFCRCDFWGP